MDQSISTDFVVRRMADSWNGTIPSLNIEVDAGSYFTLERRGRAAAAAALGKPEELVSLVRRLELEGDLREIAEARRRVKDAQREATHQAIRTTAALARQLTEEQGFSLRDAAVIIGVSHKELRIAFQKVEALEAA